MALKKSVTKDEHSKLPADVQKEYVADGENFKLDVEGGFEDVAALKRAKDHEKTAAAEAKRLLHEAQTQLAALTEERDGLLSGAIPKKDVERLEGSYKTKLAAKETELNAKIAALTGNLNTLLVDNEAARLASKLSTAPEIILPHIKKRLSAETVDGKAVTRVLDAEGKPSASTLEDLEKEIIANPTFAPILTGSKGSGGGAAGAGGGGAPSKGKVDWSKPMNPKEQVAAMKAANLAPAVTE